MEYKDPIHLLLTDTVMPKMNGQVLAVELGSQRPKMRVLYMSGYPLEILPLQGSIVPSIHLIQKPFSNETLALAHPRGFGSKTAASSGGGGQMKYLIKREAFDELFRFDDFGSGG